MFILSYISSSLDFWSVNHTFIYVNSELKVFKKIKASSKKDKNWPNDLFVTNVYKTYESCW